MTLDKLMAQGVRLPYATGSERPFTIVASRSHLSPETEAYIEEMKQKHSRIEIASKGSSLKLCLIAEGKQMFIPALPRQWNGIQLQAMLLSGLPEKKSGKLTPAVLCNTTRRIC